MPTAEAAPAGRTTTTAVDNAAADEFLGLQALFVALSDHARDHNVPARRSLRQRIRAALASGVVQPIRIGRRTVVRRADVPVIAKAVGLPVVSAS